MPNVSQMLKSMAREQGVSHAVMFYVEQLTKVVIFSTKNIITALRRLSLPDSIFTVIMAFSIC